VVDISLITRDRSTAWAAYIVREKLVGNLAASSMRPRTGAAVPPTRAELHARIAPFASANSFSGYKSFVLDLSIYMLGIGCVLSFGGLAWKIAGGLVAGIGLVKLGSLSHEAAHRAVVKSRLGNKIIAVVSMTVILFNYRLWIYDHHVLHHGRTNVKHNNFLAPITVTEYRAMPRFRRALYRAYHSPSGLGILLYFLLERWPTVHLFPGASLPPRFRASAWRYTALLGAYAAVLLSLLALVAPGSVVASILCGFVLPCLIWYATFSMTVFLQHTNPRLRWYPDVASLAAPPEALSVHVLMPQWLNHATHYAMEHPVHHLSAMVPHYRLKQAQAALAEVAGRPVITMPFTPAAMREVLRRCRLYDYDSHHWLDFNGQRTAAPLDSGAAGLRQAAKSSSDGLLPDQAEPDSPGIFFPPDGDAAANDAAAGSMRLQG
jgi:omega-6 fatty acid desaturase (delta-12 desaturase)